MLRPRPSRFVWIWWCGLHGLLGASALLVAGSWPARLVVLAAILRHAVARRPLPAPALMIVGADGRCSVPEWDSSHAMLDARTVVYPQWIRLVFGTSLGRRNLLLFSDQLGDLEWARLRALLARAPWDSAHVSRRSKEPI